MLKKEKKKQSKKKGVKCLFRKTYFHTELNYSFMPLRASKANSIGVVITVLFKICQTDYCSAIVTL